jgi:uncharacterized protein (UPF0332 family)
VKEIRDFINKGDAYDKRIIGDYGVGFTVTKEQVKGLFETAQDFVSKLKDFLQK